MLSDQDEIPVKCPHCLNEFYEKVGSLKNRNKIRCTANYCNSLFWYEPTELGRMLSDAENGLGNFAGRVRLFNSVPKQDQSIIKSEHLDDTTNPK